MLELGVLLAPVAVMMSVLFAITLGMIYGIKRLFGFGPAPQPEGEWRPAHQHLFFAGEKIDRHTCRWKTRDYEGCASGRGTIHEERWRGGAVSGATWTPRRDLRNR